MKFNGFDKKNNNTIYAEALIPYSIQITL